MDCCETARSVGRYATDEVRALRSRKSLASDRSNMGAWAGVYIYNCIFEFCAGWHLGVRSTDVVPFDIEKN